METGSFPTSACLISLFAGTVVTETTRLPTSQQFIHSFCKKLRHESWSKWAQCDWTVCLCILELVKSMLWTRYSVLELKIKKTHCSFCVLPKSTGTSCCSLSLTFSFSAWSDSQSLRQFGKNINVNVESRLFCAWSHSTQPPALLALSHFAKCAMLRHLFRSFHTRGWLHVAGTLNPLESWWNSWGLPRTAYISWFNGLKKIK